MARRLDTLIAADILAEGIARHADIEYLPLPDEVAHLELVSGNRPLLLLDSESATEDLCWAMMDVLRLLAFGPRSAESAVPVRRLRSVG